MMVLCSLMDYMKQAGDENKLNRNVSLTLAALDLFLETCKYHYTIFCDFSELKGLKSAII